MAGPVSRDSMFAEAIYSQNAGFWPSLRLASPGGQAVSSAELISGYSSYEEIQDLHTRVHELL